MWCKFSAAWDVMPTVQSHPIVYSTHVGSSGIAPLRRMTVKTTLAVILFWSLCASSVARAVCVGPSANSYGAKGDGHTDDTVAIQSAINAAGSAGGGSVVFNVARYYTTGTFVVPRGVVLCGAAQGPFDVAGVNPAVTTIAPTLLITNTSGPFITLQGIGAGVTDLLFHYPNQAGSSAAAPNVYPYTISVVNAPAAKIARCTVTNAYNFLDIEVGRAMAQDLFIGAFHTGVNISVAGDHVSLRNLLNQVFWDVLENATYPRPIDTWVLDNGSALVVGSVDLEVHNFFAFSRYAGIVLNNAGNCGTALGSDIDLDTVQYGIIVSEACTTIPGSMFTNVDIGAAPGLGQAAVQLATGGKIEINGGSQRGTWALGAYPPPGPDAIIVNILP